MDAPSNARSNARPMLQAMHDTYATYATNERDQDQGRKSYVPDAANPVDKPIRYFHGGVRDLRIGDLITPGHDRKMHDGCPWCEARARGEAFAGIDAPSVHTDRVYFTTERLYAKHYASLWGRGDLYRVEPVGKVERSTEDSIETFMTPALRVVGVYERAVLLTMSERRRLFRLWGLADAVAAS